MSQVRTEIAASGQLDLNNATVRSLAGIASGQIALSNLWGKTYCACNCNYACTCVCNYCTCNCNYACTCVCNYACTCNCNYSCTCNCNYTSCGPEGCCPAPEVPILLADGTEKPAGEIKEGDLICAWDEKVQEYVDARVIVAKMASNYRMFIKLSNGLDGLFAKNHKFLSGTDWVELQNLRSGDELSNGVTVVSTKMETVGPVVLITVEEVHTYVTLGVISHNARKI